MRELQSTLLIIILFITAQYNITATLLQCHCSLCAHWDKQWKH